MKAIKDLKRRVKIEKRMTIYGCWWTAKTKATPIDYLYSNPNFSSINAAKRNWEKFAKLNGIKKWRYV